MVFLVYVDVGLEHCLWVRRGLGHPPWKWHWYHTAICCLLLNSDYYFFTFSAFIV